MKKKTLLRNRLVLSSIYNGELNTPYFLTLSRVEVLRTSCADAPHSCAKAKHQLVLSTKRSVDSSFLFVESLTQIGH